MEIAIVILTAFIILWLIGVYLISDLPFTSLNYQQFRHVLFVYPHPDDEVLTSGGLTQLLTNNNIKTTLITLTKGEKGTPHAYLNKHLKKIRTKELTQVTNLLMIHKLIHEDFGDGELDKKESRIKIYLDNQIKKLKPDAIITYDLSGLYGHPDHIIVSKTITELIDKKYTKIKLIYVSQCSKTLRFMSLPTHMAKDKSHLAKRTIPTHKLFIGLGVFNKIRAVYAHQSQLFGFYNSFPKWLPIWFLVSLSVFEYFHEAN